MINKNRFGVANDKKLLRKIGKQWVTVSALTLVLLGGGAVASSIVTHADTTTPAVEAQDTNSIKEQINNNLDKAYQVTQSANGSSVSSSSKASSASTSSANTPSNVESKASNMHDALMMNAAKSSNNSNSTSTSSVSSSASGSVSASAKPSFNSAYQSYMAQMSGTDAKVASANDSNAKNSNNNNNQNQPVIKHNLGNVNDYSQYFTGATHTGADEGLNYIAYANGGVEFTGGTAQSDLSDFSDNNDVDDALSIKFDNDVDTSHATDMQAMFHACKGLTSIDLGNNFDTSNVTTMHGMFEQLTSLQSINFGAKFNTSHVTDMGNMFNGLNYYMLTLTIQSPNTKFNSSDQLSDGYYKQLPEQDSHGNNYTLSTINDFSKGNVGTFVTHENPAPYVPVNVEFQYNGKDIQFSVMTVQPLGTVVSTNAIQPYVPTNYELVNPSQKIVAGGGTHVVPVKINYDAIINSLVNEASSESAAIASYEASSAYISNADKWVQSNSNSAQSADSWIASNSSNATHASSQASTNSSAISSLSASTNANHSADSNSIASLSNSVASASAAISSNSTTDSSIVNSLASSASHAMVVGTAYLTLLYKRGSRTDGQVLRLHINGNIGDSDIVINPQDYDRDGYSIAPSDKNWHIPFDYNDVKKATNDFSRYNREHTFTYKANATDIKIQYVDTQTKSNIGRSDDLGSIAYDGDTADLQGTDDNNVLNVDGHEYHLNLPNGYHLAHSNNYITIAANSTYVKPVTTVSGTRMLRMPLMKLTLDITPHFNKPTSNSSVAPKPSSASSATPQSASSASTESSSASVIPSSASQSVAPSISKASNTIAPSSMASVAPVTPSVTSSPVTSTKASSAQPSSIASASVSVKSSSTNINPVSAIAGPVTHHAYHKRIAKKPVTKPIAHKNTANHNEARLNHSVTKATKQLNTVEHHMKARKSIIRKAVRAKRVIKHAKHKLHYLRRNKRHVAHALRRITRNKVAIKHAKRVVRTAKQARPSFVHAKAAPVEPTTDKSAAPSVKAPVATPKVHAKSTATTYANRKKLPQTSEATDHAGIVAIILMIMSVILAGFDKVFSREHNE